MPDTLPTDPVSSVADAVTQGEQLAGQLDAEANTPAMQQAAQARLKEAQREAFIAVLDKLLANPEDAEAMAQLRDMLASQ